MCVVCVCVCVQGVSGGREGEKKVNVKENVCVCKKECVCGAKTRSCVCAWMCERNGGVYI